jgi:molybdenum cofactor cytidylyltransferase
LSSHYFKELLSLEGDSGARSIIQSNINRVVSISFPKGEIDIDTEGDYKRLLEEING